MNSHSDINSVALAAADYQRRGFSFIPLWYKSKKPALSTWKEFQNRRPSEEECRSQFSDEKQNIGIIAGAISGLTIVDFDTIAAYEDAIKQGMPETPTVKTAKGYHCYFKYLPGSRNFQKRNDLKDIDLRSEGGYVAAPPSIHESGHKYSWVEGKSLDDLPLAVCPDWFFARTPAEKIKSKQLIGGVKQGGRNNALASLCGKWFTENRTLKDVLVLANTWNMQNEPMLPDSELTKTVESIHNLHRRNDDQIVENDWTQPLLFETKTILPPIPAALLPGCCADYADAVSKYSQTPPEMSVMYVLATLATCIQRKAEVAPYNDTYRETLSVWAATVMEPGERKSAVRSEITAPLSEWEREQADALEPDIRESQVQRDLIRKRTDQLKSEAGRAETNSDRETITRQIVELLESQPDEIKAPRLWTSDATSEQLQNLLADNNECISVISDEGGIFENMGGLYSGGQANNDVYLQGHCGQPLRIDRGSRTVMLKRPAVTFGIAFQPQVLEKLGAGNKKSFRGTGLLARFLICIPEGRVGKRNVRERYAIPEAVRTRYFTRIKELLALTIPQDEFGNDQPVILTLSEEARELWLCFSEYIEDLLINELQAIRDWGAKLPGNALRIAGLFHIAEHKFHSAEIQKDLMEKALDLCDLLIPHALAAFSRIGSCQEVNDAVRIFKWIISRQPPESDFTQHECHRSLHGTFNKVEDLKKPLHELVQRHIISGPHKITTKKGGRPSDVFRVNPYIFQEEK